MQDNFLRTKSIIKSKEGINLIDYHFVGPKIYLTQMSNIKYKYFFAKNINMFLLIIKYQTYYFCPYNNG
jgi:hypothetical protein